MSPPEAKVDWLPPPDWWLEWLCWHPEHRLQMIEIEGVFCPVIVDENDEGPIIPPVPTTN